MKDNQTPLMKQYSQIKNKYPETVLLYRLGDFFETFGDDAVITAKVCGIILTKRNNGSGEMPLAGFPHHQLDTYLPKLVKAGYRVAVCEQLEDPKKAKGIVKRGVVEVVTPGVAVYDKLLDSNKNNYLCSLLLAKNKSGSYQCAIAFADISTGEFSITEINSSNFSNVLESIAPAEIIISKDQRKEAEELISTLSFKPAITRLEAWIFDYDFAKDLLLKRFEVKSLKGFGIDDKQLVVAAAGAAIHYISETQSENLPQIRSVSAYNPEEYMTLDYATRRNLEILFSSSGNEKSSLLSIIDKTNTPMGARLLKKWISLPLIKRVPIIERLDAVKALYGKDIERLELRGILSRICDLERVISKICLNRCNSRDFITLKNSLQAIRGLKELIAITDSSYLNDSISSLNELSSLCEIIEEKLYEEPALNFGSGKMFKRDIDSQLDEYVDIKYTGKTWLQEYQEEQRLKTGISTLKVGFTSVFGYYIEVSKGQKDKAPADYERRQTLANAERFITQELKQFEVKALNAEEKISEIEQNLFQEIRIQIASYATEIQRNANLVAILDCLQSFAEVSKLNDYVEPEIDDGEDLVIEDGRHPVVEKLLPVGENFTSNSININTIDSQLHIITGPNMSGKSCYLRQNALIVLMAQIGCFVPAKKAKIGVVDRIFTRVGAQDYLSAGESTFLVEMQETANILNNATHKSLILLDEVGRGTATFDGISLAWSIAEYIHNKVKAKTLFATHYHELIDLESRYERIKNYKVEVIESGNQVIFSHNVKPGASDHSFGIHVAKLAGMPYDVLIRAETIMEMLEGKIDSDDAIVAKKPNISKVNTKKRKSEGQIAIFEFRDDELRERLTELNINNLTPIQALQYLADLKKDAAKPIKTQ